MKRLLLLIGLFAAPAWCQCTIQSFAGSQAKSIAPTMLNSNFTSLNNCKGTVFTGTNPPTTVSGSVKGSIFVDSAHGLTYQCMGAGPCTSVATGNWVCLNCGSGAGTVTVVGAGNLTSNQCVTGGGSQTVQTPSPNCTVDSNGNVSAKSITTNDTSVSGSAQFAGFTSGGFAIVAADIAGSSVGYVWPTSVPMTFPKSLQITGTVTCPTLAAGNPTTCYQLSWQ